MGYQKAAALLNGFAITDPYYHHLTHNHKKPMAMAIALTKLKAHNLLEIPSSKALIVHDTHLHEATRRLIDYLTHELPPHNEFATIARAHPTPWRAFWALEILDEAGLLSAGLISQCLRFNKAPENAAMLAVMFKKAGILNEKNMSAILEKRSIYELNTALNLTEKLIEKNINFPMPMDLTALFRHHYPNFAIDALSHLDRAKLLSSETIQMILAEPHHPVRKAQYLIELKALDIVDGQRQAQVLNHPKSEALIEAITRLKEAKAPQAMHFKQLAESIDPLTELYAILANASPSPGFFR